MSDFSHCGIMDAHQGMYAAWICHGIVAYLRVNTPLFPVYRPLNFDRNRLRDCPFQIDQALII